MARNGVILLVEDNADDEQLTLRALKKNSIANQVVVARDGAEAIDYLFGTAGGSPNLDVLPEVILLDLKLPKIDGLEVLRRLRENERTAHLPVVVLTSSNEEQDLVQSYRLGKVLFWDKERRGVREADPSWAAMWEGRSKKRGKPNQIIGWEGGESGSLIVPPEYQKLDRPRVDGKDPAEGA